MSDMIHGYRTIDIRCDRANDVIPPIFAITGDDNGRILRVALTDNGKNVNSSEKLHAQLLINPSPYDSGSIGDLVDMTPVEGETATFETTIPAGAVSKPGLTRMGIAFLLDNTDGTQDIVCSRPFTANVEQGVLRIESDTAIGAFEAAVRQAVASAQAAKTSEANASSSAAKAEQSASNASTSAASAKTSETNAANSETNAKTSETAAKASETSAAQSARDALSSAQEANASETNAAYSASAAAISETNASSSAITASEAAASAQTSETNASDSATAAAQSALGAQLSASAAASSAQASKTSEANSASFMKAASSAASSAAVSAEAAKTSETNAALSSAEAQQAVGGFGLEAGSTSTREPGTDAVVEITKQGTKYRADFAIPRGDKGEPGDLTVVAHDETLTGDGTSSKPLAMVRGTVNFPIIVTDTENTIYWNMTYVADHIYNGCLAYGSMSCNQLIDVPSEVMSLGSGAFYGFLMNLNGLENSNNTATQLLFSRPNNAFYFRARKPFGVWNEWQKIITADILNSYVPLSTYQVLETRVQALETIIQQQQSN